MAFLVRQWKISPWCKLVLFARKNFANIWLLWNLKINVLCYVYVKPIFAYISFILLMRRKERIGEKHDILEGILCECLDGIRFEHAPCELIYLTWRVVVDENFFGTLCAREPRRCHHQVDCHVNRHYIGDRVCITFNILNKQIIV